MVRLRGGRGPKDDTIAQLEFLSQRAKNSAVDTIPEWYYSLLPLYTLRTTSTAVSTSSMRFYYCPQPLAPVTIKAARWVVTAVSAGAITQTAFYVLDPEDRVLRQIPASFMTADTSAATTTTVVYPREFQLRPGLRLFLGVKALGNTCTIGGVTSSNGVPMYFRTVGGTDVLPTIQPLALLGTTQTYVTPGIVWVSPDAYNLM